MNLSLLNKGSPEGNIEEFRSEDDFMAELRKHARSSLFTSAQPRRLYYTPPKNYTKRGR